MGVNTKGFIDSKYKLLNIKQVVEQKLGCSCEINSTHASYYNILNFEYKGEYRRLSVFEDYNQEDLNKIGTLLDLNHWGYAEEIMASIVEVFGGMFLPNDSGFVDDDWRFIQSKGNFELSDQQIKEYKLYSKLTDSGLKMDEQQKVINYVLKNLEFIKSL